MEEKGEAREQRERGDIMQISARAFCHLPRAPGAKGCSQTSCFFFFFGHFPFHNPKQIFCSLNNHVYLCRLPAKKCCLHFYSPNTIIHLKDFLLWRNDSNKDFIHMQLICNLFWGVQSVHSVGTNRWVMRDARCDGLPDWIHYNKYCLNC